ncbi:hypothetical protein O181_024014 [Austropuccinia psidii MF-1]|uniref:Uncharacterized protein n=1 Tax=Austropuccinia psidii MF-1 TaxID=1389203 RepID=A0A9Q3GZ89_9BASI|nr:hypothetical protein [Austropuccinia psidii MF-1]
MSPVHLRNQPEDRESLEEDTLDTVVDGKTLREIINTLPLTFQFNRKPKPEDWKHVDQLLQLHQLLKDLFQWSMENKRLNLASQWAELGESFQKICLKEIPYKYLMVVTKGWNPDMQLKILEERAIRIREKKATIQAIEKQLNQTEPTLIPSGSQGSPGEEKDTKGKKDLFQPQKERVRPNDPEAFGLGEISTQEPEIAVNTSRISSPTNRNITPTQNEHNIVTPESNLKSYQLWLQMSQFSVQTQEKLDELHRNNERLKKLTTLQEATIKAIQESCAKLYKASEKTNKTLNKVFEE